MLPETVISEFGWSVDRRYGIHDGAEKIVYPVRQNGILCAAKIYREINAASYEPIDRVVASRAEYKAYKVTSQSDLFGYIPTPIKMIQEATGKDVGLLVTWEDGDILADINRKCLNQDLVEEMRKILLGLPRHLWLNPDSLSEANIGWNGRHLWLAEPKISTYRSPEHWREMANQQMNLLLESYCYS